jgi:hypothetical protein
MNNLKIAAVALFTSLWPFLYYLSFFCYLQAIQFEIPFESQGKVPLTSFPFTRMSERLFLLGTIWLVSVLLFWSVYAARKSWGSERA